MSIQRTLRNLIRRLEALPDPSDDADPEAWGDAGGAVAREATEALLRHGRADLHAKGQDLVGCADPTKVRVFVYECLAEVRGDASWLDVNQAADVLGYSPSGLRRLVARGAVRFEQARHGARLRFKREWLDEFRDPPPKQPKAKPYKPRHL